ncbi:O(6)-methylguanine-induced apoptosis 2 [Triplophysa dalaica]|uniref:O(6)-methylguanine-induced apoptosis 2 n=1 Tax=Triplophysa dalaica TaxID=1582913 RepID=UPI0024DF7AFA|nr:O(6)-methylguanine-induced apoptosis 2 [Triplophysa dalaica]XP_056598110.1 O(6)-methylguanine-induced apoptosis 2 [Triplophysa dalaica]XP_056598111.1 O(6)-methylguanine-induced apoptosis 2 [Triplophysa dalaica]
MGKLHKGWNQSEGCASSIPTKYRTVIINNEEMKGFTSQSKRFQERSNENPGSSSYISHTTTETCSPSFSKRGTGSFASKAGRVPRNVRRGNPGPDAYNLQTSLLHQHDFNRGESRTFRLPIAVKRETPKIQNPAPNQYHVSYSAVDRDSTVSARCAFLSKTRRSGSFLDNCKGPSPCHYQVNEVLVQQSPKVTCFKSTTARVQPPVRNDNPGPGTYSPYQTSEPVKRTILPRRYYLGLSAPPLIPAKDPPLPGPGHYDIIKYSGPVKQPVSSAAFLSGTHRGIQESTEQQIPGPGYYEPKVLSKMSFLYNPEKNWIPT